MLNDPLVRDRASEFPLLQRETYLDHAGSSLFSASQFNSATKELSGFLPRNPHSSPNEKIHECRLKVLEFLGASNDYVTVFNSGSSGGLSSLGHILLLGDPNIKFYYLDESHTSLVGLRELSGSYDCFSREDMDSLDSQFFGDEETSLIAFPAMSNFCGYKFPFEDWIRKIRLIENQEKRKIYILLDTASYASNNQLDLSAESGIDPDFVVLSFYKIFGYPTGVGALVLKDECLKTLLRVIEASFAMK
uniref:Molybdenum cofactor sulfurase n=1 Tax=Caligus rogercresseyi TaxID=217165 RepID=C1BQY1_CALRO|nr:Molybdenum cofactor sulfurase [Caligus rogercresseyi]